MSFDYGSVPGDYQFRALHQGPSMQRFWHAGKLVVIDELVRPHLKPGDRLLEIGCGAGNLLLRAAVAGSLSVALDVSIASLQFVQGRLRQAASTEGGSRSYGCVQAVGERLPFASHTFDCVLLSEVIEHLETPEHTVAQAVRALRPGGRLLVTTPNYRSFWPVMERAVDLLGRAPKMAGEQHIRQFTARSLRDLLDASGLSVDYSGTIYGLSPFLSMASTRWAMSRLRGEIAGRSSMGMVLVAVGVKDEDS